MCFGDKIRVDEMGRHPNFFFSFFLLLSLISFVFFSHHMGDGYSIFFSERNFLFRFLLLPRA